MLCGIKPHTPNPYLWVVGEVKGINSKAEDNFMAMAYLCLIHIRECEITYVENPEVAVWVVLRTIFLEVGATNQDTVVSQE